MSIGPNVLVVDDDRYLRELLVSELTSFGKQVKSVSSAEEAITSLRDIEFDVVLSDLVMPDMDGLALLQVLEEEGINAVPVVLTGNADVSAAVKALKLGAYDFLSKPISSEVLDATVDRAYQHKRTVQEANTMRMLAADWETTFNSIPELIVVLDSNERVIRCNQAALERYGATLDEIRGNEYLGILRDRECPELFYEGLDGEIGTGPTDVYHTLWKEFFEVQCVPLRQDNKLVKGILHIVRDVTEQRNLQSQLAQAQKLESIGQLAAGIAHEINTPTQYVGDNTRFLQDAFADLQEYLGKGEELLEAVKENRVSPDLISEIESTREEVDLDYLTEEIPNAIGQSLEGVGRVARIVLAMKEFSHPGKDEKTDIDINHAIQSTITVARNEWKYVADLATELDPNLPLVPCLPGDFNQVILNLVINAAHAIADPGAVAAAEKGKILISTKMLDEEVEIRIHDTGCGIPSEIRQRIFDPFFTTKEVGKGTGQGLSIAQAVVVQKHGGTLQCESEVGVGTTFTIRLPLEDTDEARDG